MSASTLTQFRADPIAFLRQLATQGGPMPTFRVGRHTLALVTEPDILEELLVTKQASFRKGPGLLRTRPLLGDGADHRRSAPVRGTERNRANTGRRAYTR